MVDDGNTVDGINQAEYFKFKFYVVLPLDKAIIYTSKT